MTLCMNMGCEELKVRPGLSRHTTSHHWADILIENKRMDGKVSKLLVYIAIVIVCP